MKSFSHHPKAAEPLRPHKSPRAFRALVLRFISILLLSTAPLAAIPTLKTSYSTKSYFVGEEFRYEVLINGAKEITADEPESSADLAVKFSGQTQAERDGLTTTVLTYRMLPLQQGNILMPAINIRADDTYLTTGPLDEEELGETIFAAQAEGHPGLTLTQTLPDRDLYVGEPFLADYQWKSSLPLKSFRAINFDIPLFYESGFKNLSPSNWIDPNDSAAIGLPVGGNRLIARYAQLKEADQFFNTVSFAKIIIPTKAGEFTLRPATLLSSYVAPPEPQNPRARQAYQSTYPSYFNNNFFDQAEGEDFEKYYTASRSHRLVVLPLPDSGKPEDFAGQVGSREITVTASPTVLKVGEPITLTITVSGNDFPEVVELPSLEEQTAFTRQFAIPPRQSSGRIEGKEKSYIRTIRPLAQDATAIPAIRLPFFDPETKSYGVAQSPPIPITVSPAEMVTAFDATLSGTGPLRNLVQKNPEGIRANIVSPDALEASSVTRLQPIFWLALILPPLGFLVFVILSAPARRRRKDPAAARAKAAYKHFNTSVKKARTLADLDQALRTYFSEKLNISAQAHTFPEIEPILSDAGAQITTIAKLKAVYLATEAKTYGTSEPSATDIPDLIARTRTAVSAIDPKLN
ncbi:BatD family protein [Luteolibacter sp. AS25]|uniref:BatD family protein n=1 Tax=Luteolibacter sp. AS25 TaxID=3135776 RepID=UPI00398AD977